MRGSNDPHVQIPSANLYSPETRIEVSTFYVCSSGYSVDIPFLGRSDLIGEDGMVVINGIPFACCSLLR